MAKILIIDENQEQRQILVRVLKTANHQVVEAWDGSNAIHKADQDIFNLIISKAKIPKISMFNFLRSLRAAKNNQFVPVILYEEVFDEETLKTLSKFGRVSFMLSAVLEKEIIEKSKSVIESAQAADKEKERQQLKVYTFSQETLDTCNKVGSDSHEDQFIDVYPGLLEQIDPEKVDFGIWIKGSKNLVEYISPNFNRETNKKHLQEVQEVVKRLKSAVSIFVKQTDKQKLYDHMKNVRLAKLETTGLKDKQKEVAELYNKMTACGSRFLSRDIDENTLATAEQLAMDVIQKVSQKEEFIDTLIEMLKKDNQLYDFISIVNIMALSVAQKLNLNQASLKTISLGCMFHDIGLSSLNLAIVPSSEMTKPELMLYREHPSIGVDELNKLESKGMAIPEEVFHITLQHHEKFNGSGFPNEKKGRFNSKTNLTGTHIFAAIVALADKYAYYLLNETKNNNIDQKRIVLALNRLENDFDPAVLKAFNDLMKIKAEKKVSSDGKVDWFILN